MFLLEQHRCLLLTYSQLFLHPLLVLLYRNDLSEPEKIHLFLRVHATRVHPRHELFARRSYLLL